MTSKKRNTRGKPPRYEGEKSTRLSVLIRPRYRQMLEIIAKDRDSTLSEAIELAISLLGRNYQIDSDNYAYKSNLKPVVADYVRSPYEPLDRIFYSLVPESRYYEIFENDPEAGHCADPEHSSTYSQITSKLSNTPMPLLSSLEKYIGAVINGLEKETKYFYPAYLLEALEENWKEGISIDESRMIIQTVYDFYISSVSDTLDLNPMINSEGSLKDIGDYFKSLNNPYGSDEGELQTLHEIYLIRKHSKKTDK